jgi:hypothetical protein
LLTIIFLVSTLLAVQLVFKFKKEGSGKD